MKHHPTIPTPTPPAFEWDDFLASCDQTPAPTHTHHTLDTDYGHPAFQWDRFLVEGDLEQPYDLSTLPSTYSTTRSTSYTLGRNTITTKHIIITNRAASPITKAV